MPAKVLASTLCTLGLLHFAGCRSTEGAVVHEEGTAQAGAIRSDSQGTPSGSQDGTSPSDSQTAAPTLQPPPPGTDAPATAPFWLHSQPSPPGADAPLPAPDEIPGFLAPSQDALRGLLDEAQGDGAPREDAVPPAAGGVTEPSLAELMEQVHYDDASDEEGSFASVTLGSTDADPAPAPTQRSQGANAGEAATPARASEDAEAAPDAADTPPEEASSPKDACAGIRQALAQRQDYLKRIGAERSTYAYVEDPADAAALRLLQGLRRCAEFPDDEDCKARPMEVELRDLEPPRHTYESWPSELEAEAKEPDEVAHDPQVRELLHQLRACESRRKAQPLLE